MLRSWPQTLRANLSPFFCVFFFSQIWGQCNPRRFPGSVQGWSSWEGSPTLQTHCRSGREPRSGPPSSCECSCPCLSPVSEVPHQWGTFESPPSRPSSRGTVFWKERFPTVVQLFLFPHTLNLPLSLWASASLDITRFLHIPCLGTVRIASPSALYPNTQIWSRASL